MAEFCSLQGVDHVTADHMLDGCEAPGAGHDTRPRVAYHRCVA